MRRTSAGNGDARKTVRSPGRALVLLAAALAALGLAALAAAQSGPGDRLSLNSPTSFPVDI